MSTESAEEPFLEGGRREIWDKRTMKIFEQGSDDGYNLTWFFDKRAWGTEWLSERRG